MAGGLLQVLAIVLIILVALGALGCYGVRGKMKTGDICCRSENCEAGNECVRGRCEPVFGAGMIGPLGSGEVTPSSAAYLYRTISTPVAAGAPCRCDDDCVSPSGICSYNGRCDMIRPGP